MAKISPEQRKKLGRFAVGKVISISSPNNNKYSVYKGTPHKITNKTKNNAIEQMIETRLLIVEESKAMSNEEVNNLFSEAEKLERLIVDVYNDKISKEPA